MEDAHADLLAQFTSITDSTVAKAQQYLSVCEWNLENAIELYFGNDGADLNGGRSTTTATTSTSTAQTSSHPPPASSIQHTPAQPPVVPAGRSTSDAIPIGDSDDDVAFEDDEAMAARLQREAYGESDMSAWGGAGAGGQGGGDDVRAPMQRVTETLVGPSDDAMSRMLERMNRSRQQPARPTSRAPVGIFNQRAPIDVDDDLAFGDAPEARVSRSEQRRRALAAATNGASESSSRANRLAELYNPPFDLMTRTDFSTARDIGKEKSKWLMVNIQDSTVFDSQVLNRDIWKDPAIKSTVKENFLFMQYDATSPEGLGYMNLYLPNTYQRDLPHIGIVDPRTGELLKSWTRVPDKMEFLIQLHEFLERYSLDPMVKMPVQKKPKAVKKDVDAMTEEEMLQLAMEQSLDAAHGRGNGSGSGSGAGGAGGDKMDEDDPDALTKSDILDKNKGKQTADEEDLIDLGDDASTSAGQPASRFASIARDQHHAEPPMGPGVTRIQFRLPDGSRAVRRFAVSDLVLRIFEYVKADLLPEQAKKSGNVEMGDPEFELKSLGKNLIDLLDSTVEEAGLKVATVMVDMES